MKYLTQNNDLLYFDAIQYTGRNEKDILEFIENDIVEYSIIATDINNVTKDSLYIMNIKIEDNDPSVFNIHLNPGDTVIKCETEEGTFTYNVASQSFIENIYNVVINKSEIIDRLESLRIDDGGYFGVGNETRIAYDRANEMLDNCIEIINEVKFYD